ncbi:MAG: Nif3-like dinuclear metal center hexameric protein [Bacteroidetes bacterium]|nr:Nif3-like dinuclear metal center hexameric protein [Bacteroidota bacterium]
MRISLITLLIVFSCSVFSQDKKPTAVQIIDKIKQNTGVPWREPTVDVFKAGDSTAAVTGIAVTMMATLDVLKQAAAKGHNLIITHETPFYSHFNPDVPMETYHDPVYEAKQAFIKEHKLVLWQFHDNIHAMKPDGILTGMVYTLGWKYYRDRKNELVFHLPPTTLKDMAKELKEKLGISAMRVIGDPDASLTTVGLAPGFGGFARNRELFQQNGVEVLIIGEAHEWEMGEYAADAVTAGMKKGMIILGHIPSEQAGMEESVRWLKKFITNVPIEFIPAKEPFWVP